MPITQNLIWTSLPNGMTTRTLADGTVESVVRLSVYISPRLDPGAPEGSLLSFPFFTNWPDMVRALAFDVQMDGGGPTLPATIRTDTLSKDLWTNLFFPPSGAALVRGHGFQDKTGRTIRSYPVKKIRQYIEGIYRDVASSPATGTSHPSLTGTPLQTLITDLGELDETIRRYQKDEPALLAALGTGPARDFYHVHRFYNRPGHQEKYGPLDKAKIPPRVKTPRVDFNDVLAMLGDHPTILRMLGIIIDAHITVPGSMPIAPLARVRITNIGWGSTPSPPPPPGSNTTPWTNYRINAAGFLPRPRNGSDLLDGMLPLSNTVAWDVVQTDIDGAALKTLDFAINMTRFQKAPPSIAPDKASLSALQTGGFTIARTDRGQRMGAQVAFSKANNLAMGAASLYADDVTRGYRVDVFYNGNWYSLCRRKAKFALPGIAAPLEITDEGYVKGAAATSTWKPGDPATTDDLYLHEGMFGWHGWSLVATLPGKSISLEHDDANKTQKVILEHVENDPATPFSIKPEIHAEKGTLPRLRFGLPYRFRARAVDLAGNSHPLSAVPATASFETGAFTYQRFEPLAPPTLIPRAAFTPGEQAENMVIRSQVGSLGLPASHFNATNDRHVVPPKTSLNMAESHAKLDPFWGDPAYSFQLGRKEQGTLQDRKIVNPATGDMDTVFGIQLVDTPEVPPDRVGVWPINRGDPLAPGQYVIHTGSAIALPYLPDAASRGLAMSGHAGPTVHKQDFAGAWPDKETFLIQLSEGPLAIGTSGGNTVIKVPRGTILKVRYSSLIDPGVVPFMAIWNQMTLIGRLVHASNIAAGQHWMLTPFRELQIVHAVEKPMEKPDIEDIVPGKQLGDTFVQLRGRMKNHSRSTGELAVRGEWTEWVDRLTDAAPLNETRAGHAFDRKVDYDEDTVDFPKGKNDPALRHELGDTRHRLIRYRPIGTTRYREYFTSEITSIPANITEAGDLSDPVNVLSSARPEPPRVLYIVPTFKWQPSPDGTTSKRIGRGLRVYLDRPWYSSGDGEQLGVLLPPDKKLKVKPKLGGIIDLLNAPDIKNYISQWGSDPVWGSTGPSTDMAPEHFENGAAPLEDLTLAEHETLKVTAVGFTPEYNPERRLWSVDIEMKPPGNTYYPFVRFALARLQPDSVANAHLSRVVRTEFAQLVADRTATINRLFSAIEITVSGVSARNEIGQNLPSPASLPPLDALAAPASQPGKPIPPGLAKPDKPVPPGLAKKLDFFTKNRYAGAGHLVRVHVEVRPAGTSGDLGWEALPGEVILESYTAFLSTDVFWRGTLPFSPPRAEIPVEYRLVIREFEVFETDADVKETLPIFNPSNVPLRSRLVYLDIFPL